MKKTSRKVILVVGIVLGVLIVLIIVLFATGKMKLVKEDGKYTILINNSDGIDDTYAKAIKISQTTHPTDIFVYGEDCHFRDVVDFTQLTELTDEGLQSDKEVKVIVVNDVDGQTELDEKDLELISKYVYDEKYIFIYLGKQKYQQDNELKIIRKDDGEEKIDGIVFKYFGDFVIQTGSVLDEEGYSYYKKGREEILGEAIFVFLRSYYRELEN